MSAFSIQFRPDAWFRDHFLAFSYLETSRGCAQYKIRFRSNSIKLWDVLNDPEYTFEFRFGLIQSEEYTDWSPWKRCKSPVFDIDMITREVVLEGFDAGYSLSETSSGKMFRDQKISEMVSQLAKINDLESDVQETKDNFTLPQGTMTDADFISKVCLPRAYNAKQKDYRFYIRDGKSLVFRPPDFDQKPKKRFLSQIGKPSNIIELHVRKHRSLLSKNAGLSNITYGWDPVEKKLITHEANENTIRFNRLASNSDKVSAKVSRRLSSLAPYDLISPDRDQLKFVSESAWLDHARELYLLYMLLDPGEASISPGDILEVDVLDEEGEPHFSSGRYLLFSSKFEYKDTFRTECTLVRRTFQ